MLDVDVDLMDEVEVDFMVDVEDIPVVVEFNQKQRFKHSHLSHTQSRHAELVVSTFTVFSSISK